ncbi:unnamed protein product (macronuclear) [Paramecium tetraurelia]|uniref:phenylalanine--tRNA ligase n=1 Tax=Paramecium tetraurelia TaxID=5888 RepID=Q6BFG1_PARTE|nr:Phenylalanyl-tRNA synthetase alpha subunit [Paramecium tetraurelia strain d4-2]XP_001423030.1 uncharacterized protein GSPATT00000067001 [Paramecium tetraurelia]CAH03610.1 Phenylalanyl-tRNA synthetase alpha subunit, putative [Paramecium tetraurelia]CAK55632.1 unnamed protein product [Paramecium tetraurelia]|eukprot:XP_001423030.1 hypothetical protein (macronuclear) [Paramecium tetraurelia strain d4-2]
MDQKQDHANTILTQLESAETLNSLEVAKSLSINHQDLVGCLLQLESANYIKTEGLKQDQLILTDEGNTILNSQSGEYEIYQKVPEAGISMVDLQKVFGIEQVPKVKQEQGEKKEKQVEDPKKRQFDQGFGNAKKMGYIKMDKGVITKVANDLPDKIKLELQSFNTIKLGSQQAKLLVERKLAMISTIKYFEIKKGFKYAPKFREQFAALTTEQLLSGEWKECEYKSINLNAEGEKISMGNLHPLLKVRKQFSQILIGLGFEEMPTNQFVESSFWNFDALFQPQKHPARDAHDTFFCSDPELSEEVDTTLRDKVKSMHQTGGVGSIGYQYEWSHEESRKNILRTHTTAVSSKMLYRIAQQYKEKGYFPKKYFSIDKVFRNETLDATHLAEFHQIEGVVIDKNASLGQLMGIIREFFRQIGINKLWFKPTYNPYTEPSMEIYGYHPVLKKKVEIGNSGVFRPEMLAPLGFPEDVNVIAWGLGLERPTMIYYDIRDIRTMVGPEVKVETVRSNAFCVFESK